MNYWNQFSVNTQHLDELLSKDDASLEEVIDDENVIGELKNLNPRLLNYFSIERIKSLVEFIVTEPPSDANTKRAYKFPFVACELLICESNTILDAFFMKEDLVREESIPEFDDSDPPSEQNEEQPKESGEGPHEEKKSSMRDEDFSEFTEAKKGKKDEIVWHNEEKDEGESEKVEESQKGSEMETYEIKVRNYDEEKRKKKEQKKVEVAEKPNPEKKEDKERKIIDRFMLLDYLFSLLDSETEVNPTLAGYFAKVFLSFFNKKQKELLEYVFARPKILDNLHKHLISRSIADIALKVLTFETNEQDSSEIKELRLNFLKKIIGSVDEKQDFELISNVYWVLTEIAKSVSNNFRSRENLNFLLRSENAVALLDLSLKNNHVLVMNSCVFLSTVFSLIITHDTKTEEEPQTSSLPSLLFDEFIEAFSGKVPSLLASLDQELDISRFNTVYGVEIEPLGLCRVKLIEILGNSLRMGNIKVNQAIALGGFFPRIMSLFVKYQWNNLLHYEVEKIMTFALESDSNILKISILKDSDFLGFLREAASQAEFQLPKGSKKRIRSGFSGHLTKIANNFTKLAEKDEDLKSELSDEKWNDFNESFLIKANESNTKDICGHNSIRDSKIKEFDDSISYDKSEIENKFKPFLTNAPKPPSENNEIIEDFNDNAAGFWQSNAASKKSPKRSEESKSEEHLWKFSQDAKDLKITEVWPADENSKIEEVSEEKSNASADIWSNIFASAPANLEPTLADNSIFSAAGFDWSPAPNNPEEEKPNAEEHKQKSPEKQREDESAFNDANYWNRISGSEPNVDILLKDLQN